MMDFVVFSLGCKVNAYEGQSMLASLIKRGFSASDELVFAKHYIINTCSVTSEADKKSRQMIARVKKLNENANIYVCGCSTQNNAQRYLVKNGVRLVGGASGKIELLDSIINDIESNHVQQRLVVDPLPKEYETIPSPHLTKTRGLIKVQDGCNNFCSYCIIPYLRGRSRSRDIASIVDEAKMLAKSSHEIVLTGINVSAYGEDIGSSLKELVVALSAVNARKRIGSLECHIITKELVLAMQDAGFCDHFHLSLQSGSDSVLKRMNRHYTTSEFLDKIDLIRKIMPSAGITTDIIVGFGDETEQEFNQTVEFVKKVRFLDAHIFPFSERKGTNAEKLPQIEKSIRLERAKYLTQVQGAIRKELLNEQIGRVLEVYFEEESGEFCVGYSKNYIKVYSKQPKKALKNIIITKVYKDGMQGE